MKWRKTSGPSIVTEDGESVRLRGVGQRRYDRSEPLADEFAACFADASDEELVALGECFAFRDCAVREDLCKVLVAGAAGAVKG